MQVGRVGVVAGERAREKGRERQAGFHHVAFPAWPRLLPGPSSSPRCGGQAGYIHDDLAMGLKRAAVISRVSRIQSSTFAHTLSTTRSTTCVLSNHHAAYAALPRACASHAAIYRSAFPDHTATSPALAIQVSSAKTPFSPAHSR